MSEDLDYRCKLLASKLVGKVAQSWESSPRPSKREYMNACLIDFTIQKVVMDIGDSVDCDDRCWEENIDWTRGTETVDEEAYEGCVRECEDEIFTWTRGSLLVDLQNNSVLESSLPLASWMIGDRDDYGELLEDGVERDTKRTFGRLGCEAGDYGWHHIHDFIGNPEEMREPDVVFVHPTARELGRCKAGPVVNAYLAKIGAR